MRRRVLADTNILVSAFIFPGSVPDQAFQRILLFDRLVLTNWILGEFVRIIATKWPDRLKPARALLAALDYDINELLHDPKVHDFIEQKWPKGEVIPAF